MAIWRGAGGSGDATTDAANEASVASTKAAEAAASATAAASSATSAANSATSADADAISASSSETNAAVSASSAATSATNASTSETNAGTSAANAAISATSAATSATNAATSETNSATSEANAATSAATAAAEAAAALAAFDNFDDKYLGAKASDPTLDNDGDPLVAGALYFNTTSGVMNVYTGSAWVAAYVSAAGVLLQVNNLSDVASALTSRANLGLTIGTDVQAHSAVLDATTASYTTAEETKLAGIETAADVTDTLNVTAAGALMDSEVTNLAQVKAFSSADYATAAQGTLADSALQPSDIGSTVQGYDADTAKLDVAQTFSANQNFNDNVKATFGTSNDLEIFHNGSNSLIRDLGDGGLILDTNGSTIDLKASGPTEYMARFIRNGAASLYYDSVEKITTTTSGVDVTGTVNATSFTGSGSSLSGLVVETSATGSAEIPSGTTAQRDVSPSAGYLRFNSTDSSFEGYDGSAWGAIGGGGGASGGGSDAIFYENGQTITTSYSITANTNAMSTGPLTVNSGVSVTVPSGSRWVVL